MSDETSPSLQPTRWDYKAAGRVHDEFDPDADPGSWVGISDHLTSYESAATQADQGNLHAVTMEHRVFRRRVGPWELVEDYLPTVRFGGRAAEAES